MNMDKLKEAAQKEFGERVRVGSEVAQIDSCPTGIPSLDIALGIGGWPKGAISMIFGPASAGKSALSYISAAEAQRLQPDKGVIIVDLEGSYDPDWVTRLGGDPNRMLVLSPVSAEEASKYLVWAIQQEDISMTIFDSIGAMASERELEEDGKKQAFGQSGIITHMINKVQGRLYDTQQVCLLINQVRDTQNRNNLPIKHPPGGNALLLACSIILQHRPGSTKYNAKLPDGKDVQIGYRPHLSVDKSKVGPPKHTAEYDFYFMETADHPVGIDYNESILSAAIRVGVIQKDAAMYSFNGLRGKDAFFDELKKDPQGIETLRSKFYEALEEKKHGQDD